MTVAPPSLVVLFVDGLGLGPNDPSRNPLLRGRSPRLTALLRHHAVPLDATLGVPGLPQSATGQAALLTGENAARIAGRHVEGFPPPLLRERIQKANVLRRLQQAGIRSTFANAYAVRNGSPADVTGRWSVTTVAAMSAYGRVRTLTDMAQGRAVYQDLTGEALVDRGLSVRSITPEQAGRTLLEIAREYRLTLFEYFQTDRAGHTGDMKTALDVLERFDRFLAVVWEGCLAQGWLMVLTSDHGNIEDLSVTTHTLHPVPLAAVGEGAEDFRNGAVCLTDLAPRLIAVTGVSSAARCEGREKFQRRPPACCGPL